MRHLHKRDPLSKRQRKAIETSRSIWHLEGEAAAWEVYLEDHPTDEEICSALRANRAHRADLHSRLEVMTEELYP